MSDWYPKAIRVPGPAWKQHGATNTASGVVCHSAVGYRGGLHYELERDHRDVGWHFSVMQDGTVEQHFPLDAVVWHCSDTWGNRNLIGIEHEGGLDPVDEPLTKAQREASVALVKWIAEQKGWVPSRVHDKTLYEHREIADRPTQCPSGRIPWGAYLIAAVPEPKPKPLPKAVEWLTYLFPGLVSRKTKWVRTEPGPGYEEDVYEFVIRRKVK